MLDFGAFCFYVKLLFNEYRFFRRKYEKKIIRLMLISLGIILILVVGYRLYLEYQTDIQLFLNPRASKAELLAHIRSHGTFASILLIVLTAVMCAVPGIPTSVVESLLV